MSFNEKELIKIFKANGSARAALTESLLIMSTKIENAKLMAVCDLKV